MTAAKAAHVKQLSELYTPGKRRLELASVAVLSALLAFCLWHWIVNFHKSYILGMVLCAALGMVSADFLSGLLHWLADTWGTVDLPVLGPAFIRSFREHHVDPVAITRHDFIEANGDTALVLIAVMIPTIQISANISSRADYFMASYLLFLCIFTLYTNEIHKWSHIYKWGPNDRLAPVVTFLQKWNIILPVSHHRVHHVSPHDVYYCITTGWLNSPLEKIGFWIGLENFIYHVSGVEPRFDDIQWTTLPASS